MIFFSFCPAIKFNSIFTSLSPNTEKDDILLALKMILRIIFRRTDAEQKRGTDAEKLEEGFKHFLGVKYAFAFNSGRSAFLAILDALGLEKENEILLQAFTCNAAVNPIIWSGLKPVYVDIESETLNIDSSDLEKKITNKSRGVVVQHTFGLPANLGEVLEICKRHNLILIEDCAHSLGATYKGKKVGTFGRASFFSFGRDKIISSVYGGMAVTNNDELAKKIKTFRDNLDYPSYFWIFQQLLHPILCNFLIMPLYSFFGLGRWILLGLQKLKILSKAVHKKEKQGQKPNYIPKKMPNALVILALNQFQKLDKFISHQKQIAQFYDNHLKDIRTSDVRMRIILPGKIPNRVYMRYPILIEGQNTDKILKKLRRQKIFLDDGWRKTPIMPPDTNQEKMGYVWGSCPAAEWVAKNILNLPTHINISKQKAIGIIDFLKGVL